MGRAGEIILAHFLKKIPYKEHLEMGNSWKSLPDRGLKNGKETRMRSTKCTVCSNETYQQDCICVLCRNYITRMHEELIALLAIDKKRKMRKTRMKAMSKSRFSRNFR